MHIRIDLDIWIGFQNISNHFIHLFFRGHIKKLQRIGDRMKFWEAMKLLDEGKEVRCSEWPKGAKCSYGNLFQALEIYGKVSYGLDWELYEEPVQLLSFSEVIKRLKDGKRFKRIQWHDGFMVYMGLLCGCFQTTQPLFPQDFEATDWIEVK